MIVSRCEGRAMWVFCLVVSVFISGTVMNAQEVYQPQVGQAGKDTVWVPTPDVLVEKMLDMALVTQQDFVIDLGSGDGRNVIAAAKRGARGLGVEYNPDMVGLSKRLATQAGVGDKATFVEGDMFEADISKATVLALFLLPDNMRRLKPKFLDLRPGTRIVANTFGIEGWNPDETQEVSSDVCSSWCTSLLFIVPAKVAGVWKLPQGELTLQQDIQVLNGSLAAGGAATPIANGRLRGDQIRFVAGDAEYTGRVDGNTMTGTVRAGGRQSNWSATRSR
jgi:SAM-dependent methyltransferase